MTTKGFMGGAGTGKTTSLLKALSEYASSNPLGPGQLVLALTFMHGARHRLAERLDQTSVRRRFEAMTIDRFAGDLCRRWRSRLRAAGVAFELNSDTPNYDGICVAAARLLAQPDVRSWLTTTYPIIVLDEFQDCALVRLALAQSLHESAAMFIAADDFQNLARTDESPAVTWLRSLNVCEELVTNHRTTDTQLLNAAQALRSGMGLGTPTGTSFMLRSIPSAPVAASFISKTMLSGSVGDVVVLSATRAGSSPWVDSVVQLIGSTRYKSAGPWPIVWEATDDSMAQSIVTELGISETTQQISATTLLCLSGSAAATQLKRWVEHQRRLLGRVQFTAGEVHLQIKRAIHRIRSFGLTSQTSRRVMTIHQAKNREFPVVFVLWPFQVSGDVALCRRLLYNAITRAKRRAIILVQDPKKNRSSAAPFA